MYITADTPRMMAADLSRGDYVALDDKGDHGYTVSGILRRSVEGQLAVQVEDTDGHIHTYGPRERVAIERY